MSDTTLQDKVQGLYERIKADFYLCRDDFHIAGASYNAALLFGVLTELSRGSQIFLGGYSRGKTTSAQYLHTLFHNLPLEVIRRRATLKGHPQLTEEKLVGFPDYGRMNTGDPSWKDNPVWEHFALLPYKILNELPRIPEATQSLFLDNVETGEWGYMRGAIDTGVQPVFFTANYQDQGSNTIIPALLDRIAIAVEAKTPRHS